MNALRLCGIPLLMLGVISCSMQPSGSDVHVSKEFEPLASVLTSPRCMNCHTTTGFPRQGDDRHPHRFNVQRGPDNHGTSAMQCSTCHVDHNQEGSGVPGAPRWGLAPMSMGWEGMSPREICEQVTDLTRNGHRTPQELQRHMTEDPLVQWAWTPGGSRTLPPLSQQEFHTAVRSWIKGGARC